MLMYCVLQEISVSLSNGEWGFFNMLPGCTRSLSFWAYSLISTESWSVLLTSIAAGIGIVGMIHYIRYNQFRIILALLLLTALPARAEVNIMKDAASVRGLIGSDGSEAITLSTAQWIDALAGIRFVSDEFLASGDPDPVFSEIQVNHLAPKIQKIFANVRSGQAVAFHAGKVQGSVFFSHGQLIWYFNLINNGPAFEFTFLAEESARTSHEIGSVSEDDVDRTHWRLAPQRGQVLHRNRPDMLAMRIDALTTHHSFTVPQPVKSAVPVQRHPMAVVDKDMSRILELSALLKRELITKVEYRGKLATIISEYETQNPSASAGLDFLHRLEKRRLIPQDMLQEQRKQILDRL